MFKNIGGKIKTLSEFVTWVGIIASVVLGIIIMFYGDIMVLVGLVVMSFGCFFSWIGSFLLYGYGQLIENSDKLVLLQTGEDIKNEPDLEKREKTHTSSVHINVDSDKIGKCDMCGKDNLPVANYTIKDSLGTRYRNMCKGCSQKQNIDD